MELLVADADVYKRQELSGGRATSSEWNGSFAWKLKYTLYGLKEVALGCNPVFWCISVGCVVAAIAALVVSREKKPGNKVDPWLSGVCIVAAAAILVYTPVSYTHLSIVNLPV